MIRRRLWVHGGSTAQETRGAETRATGGVTAVVPPHRRVHPAPSPMAESATNKLEALLGSILRQPRVNGAGERVRSAARFLAALVRAESDLASSSPNGGARGAARGRGRGERKGCASRHVIHGGSQRRRRPRRRPASGQRGGRRRDDHVGVGRRGSPEGAHLEQKPPREPRSTPRRAAGLSRLAERERPPLRSGFVLLPRANRRRGLLDAEPR